MPIQTTSITTTAANDLTLAPASGKDVKITSVTANPGTTPVAVDANNNIEKLNAAALTRLTTLATTDLIVVQAQTARADATAGTTVVGQMYKADRSDLIDTGPAGGVGSFSAGTTGFTPSTATAGNVVLAGTLGIANGGTGQTTQAAAIAALLPSQAGKSTYLLSTDGTNAIWQQTVQIAQGGTGQVTATAAINALLPTQSSGISGYFLTSNGTNTSWSNDTSGFLPPASLAEAALGTITTKYSSPQTAVPKNASGMTGSAIIPSGTTAQAPTQSVGMFRFNTTSKSWFGSNGTLFVPFDQRNALAKTVNFTAVPQDYIAVTSSAKTITLPASPTPGLCVTVVVAGDFIDVVVARNGSNIMGLAENITLNIAYAACQFTYVDATNGWRIN